MPAPRATPSRSARLRTPLALALVALLAAPLGRPAHADQAYVVLPGDTLYALAKRFRTTVDELRSANGLDGSLLTPGEVLQVPNREQTGYRSTIARPGETLADVATRVGRSVATLASANPLLAQAGVRAGAAVSVPPADGVTVVAAAGDTLTSLGAKAGVSAATLARVNGLDPSGPLPSGQPVLLPAQAAAPAAGSVPAAPTSVLAAAAATPASHAAGQALAGGSRPGGAPAGAAPPLAAVTAAAPRAATVLASGGGAARARLMALEDKALRTAVLRLPQVRLATDRFVAPVQGRLSSAFGWRALSVDGNHFHAGIDLAVPIGTPVHAARDGRVVEARFDGTYGNVVFLDHGDGSQTRYAHLSRIAVSPGQSVRQGDVVGLAGSSGWSTGPHVHFELRFDGRAVNPLDYLRGALAP